MMEEQYRLHAEMPEYKYRIKSAHNVIEQGFERCDNPYIACSFGKDSSAMLHMILQHRSDLQVLFVAFAESEILNNYKEVAQWWIDNYNINLSVITLGRGIDTEETKDVEVMSNFGDHDGYFIGLRAEESAGRRVTLKHHGRLYLNKSVRKVRISPVAFLTQDDIGAYNITNGIKTLESYQEYGYSERTASGLLFEDRWGIRESLLQRMRQHKPERYNQLKQLCPEIT